MIRKATIDDRDAIESLIAESARGLSRRHYSDTQIEAALATVFGVDSDLIEDGTYFVVEDSGVLLGCGGWSKRKNLFGGDRYELRDASYLDPELEPARIRAFFVNPVHARKGIGRMLLAHCESEARAQGFRTLELMSTLPGIEFYKSCGYVQTGTFALDLDGVKLELMPMRKEI